MACVLCSRNHHRARHDMYHHHLHRNWQPNNSIMLIRIAAIFGSNPRAWCSPCDHHGLDRFLPAESMAHALAPGEGRIDRWAGRKRRWRLRQEGLGGQLAGKNMGHLIFGSNLRSKGDLRKRRGGLRKSHLRKCHLRWRTSSWRTSKPAFNLQRQQVRSERVHRSRSAP